MLVTTLVSLTETLFTSAFLVPNSAPQTERFDSNQEYNLPQVYAGVITGERRGMWTEVDVKNRMGLGDTLEYLSPQTQYHFKINAMENPLGTAANIAHGGNGTVWIQIPQPIEPYALLAKVQEPTSAETALYKGSSAHFAV